MRQQIKTLQTSLENSNKRDFDTAFGEQPASSDTASLITKNNALQLELEKAKKQLIDLHTLQSANEKVAREKFTAQNKILAANLQRTQDELTALKNRFHL